MAFRLFGIPVEVQAGFWITAVLLGLPASWMPDRHLVVWVLVVLLSVLAHELGHAFAVMRHKIEPAITLHWMGGTTSWRAALPLRRRDLVLISLAGPFAGFFVAALVYALLRFAPGVAAAAPPMLQSALLMLLQVNLWWGVFNLIPVIPLDGGHVLVHALGPRRARLAATISLGVAALLAGWFALSGRYWAAMIFAMSAVQSWQRRQVEPEVAASFTPRERPVLEPLPPPVAAALRDGRAALDADDTQRAIALAQSVLDGSVLAREPGDERDVAIPEQARKEAHELVAWAHLGAGRVDPAADALRAARRIDEPDPALVGAIAFARRDLREARSVLEAARTRGDDRKEVVGMLIRVLLEQGEIARASAVALDIVDQLSDDDARRMAGIAFEGGAFDWSARLYEAVFTRERRPEDAYDAARALAKAGADERALELLRRAVEAGFSDHARAWSDAALARLREAERLEAVLPRPSRA